MKICVLVLAILCSQDFCLSAMEPDTEVECGGLTVLAHGMSRRTMGVQSVKVCPVCTKSLCEATFLITRLSCNSGHEVHQACLALIYKAGVCPVCREFIPEFEGARFNSSVKKLSSRGKALVDLEADAARLAPVLQLVLQQGVSGARSFLLQKEQNCQNQSQTLEEERNHIDSMLAQCKKREAELAKRLSDLEKSCAEVRACDEANRSVFEREMQKIRAIEDQLAVRRY